MTVDELVSQWTPEEREAFKDLIEESRQREQSIERARIESIRGLLRIKDNILGKIAEEIIKVTGQKIKGRA